MAVSMTGFGRGEAKGKFGTVVIEARSLNHRYLEVVGRYPSGLGPLEDRIRELTQKKFKRGRVTLSISFDRDSDVGALRVDEKRARHVHQMAVHLKKELSIPGELGLGELLAFPEVVKAGATREELTELWNQVREALEKALDGLSKMRGEEGEARSADLSNRVGILEKELGRIAKRLPVAIKQYKGRLKRRLEDLLDGSVPLDAGRLEQEVVFFVENVDITEEMTRAKTHLENFQKTLSLKEEVGRRLDFIAQELQREVNTIGQKSRDIDISQSVIQMKSEIDRIREQVQNVE